MSHEHKSQADASTNQPKDGTDTLLVYTVKESVMQQLAAMEDPLYEASQFMLVLERTLDLHDEEMMATAFVASEARARLETARTIWRKLRETIQSG